jgi:hypothetical protein
MKRNKKYNFTVGARATTEAMALSPSLTMETCVVSIPFVPSQ